MASTSSLDTFRDKDGNNMIHIYVSDQYPALMLKMMKRKDVPPQHKAFLKGLRQDRQWLLDKGQLFELVSRGCDPNATNFKGETPLGIIWDRYKKTVDHADSKSKNVGQPGKKERAALALLKECGAISDSKGNQECLQFTWSILQKMRQSGQTPSVIEPNTVMDMTPIRLLFMCSPKDQTDIIKALIGGFNITQPPLNPILTFDILYASGALLHPDVMRMGILVTFLRAVHQMFLDRPDAARHFWDPRKKQLGDLVRMYAGSAESDAVRVRDPTSGSTALHYAIRLEMDDVVNVCFLHPQADDAATDANGCTPLLLALDKLKDRSLLMYDRPIINLTKRMATNSRGVALADRHGVTPLLAITSALSTLGLKYRERQAYGILSRHLPENMSVPVGKDSSAVGYCIEADQPGLLKELMLARIPGLGLKQANAEGMTPLHLAGLLGRYECARILISGDNTLCNLQDRSGNTPLFYLIASLKPGQTLDIIRNYQALWDFGIKNNRFETVFDYYMVKATEVTYSDGIRDVLHTLVSASGAVQEVTKFANLRRDPKLFQSMSVAAGKKTGIDEPTRNLRDLVRDLNDLHELFQSVADRSRANIDAMMNGKSTAMICASHGLEDELHYLVSMGEINVNLQDPDGRTALHHAAMTGQVDCFQVVTMVPNIDLNLQDRNGNSALFYVVENFPSAEIQRLVKQLPWDFTLTNYSGESVIDHYLATVTRPNDTTAAALKKVCSPGARSRPSSVADDESHGIKARPASVKAKVPSVSSPRAIPSQRPPELSDDDEPASPPGPSDPSLLRRRPTVGQLANQLEGLIRRPKRNSLIPSEVSPTRKSGDESSFYPYPTSPGSPRSPIRSRDERGSAKNKVQRFSYLESNANDAEPSPPPYQVYRSSSFKNIGSPPRYQEQRSPRLRGPQPPLSSSKH